MSRSILKTSDSKKRLIPITANEGKGEDDYDTLNKVKPWCPVDDEPMMMAGMNNNIHQIHTDLSKMHERMMPFPSAFDGMPHPPPLLALPHPPALAPLPFPDMPLIGHHRNGSPSNMIQVGTPDSGSPYGSLQRHPGKMSCGPLALAPNNMPFGPPPDMLMPPMPPMAMPPPGPTPVFYKDEYGNKNVEIVLEIKGFMPEDIHIHTEGTVLHVHARRLSAKHDVNNEGNFADARVAKESRQQFTLPDVVRAENLQCFVNQRGKLTIEGPLGPDIVRVRNKKKVKFLGGDN